MQNSMLRLCTIQDFERINAAHLFLKRFPDGINTGSLICDDSFNIGGSGKSVQL